MKDQVVMSTNNAQLAVAIPLYRRVSDGLLDGKEEYEIIFHSNIQIPAAYIIDCGDQGSSVLGAIWVEENLIFLGDL